MSFLSFMRERDAEACVLCIFEPLLLCAAAGSVVLRVLLLESYDLASRTHHQVVSRRHTHALVKRCETTCRGEAATRDLPDTRWIVRSAELWP